jgi:glycosyltransferase involved in cell wall biosynthesis
MIMTKISIIVPTFSRPEILGLVLEALCRQTQPSFMAEVIVVCDGSDEKTRAAAQRFEGRLPLLYLEQSKSGVSSARNLGIATSRSPVVLFLDDDVLPAPGLVGEHARFHEERSAENAVLLGYVTWHHNLHCSPYMKWYGEYGGLFAFSLLEDNRLADPRFFYSCNISIKRQFLIDHGGFNETLSVMEDNELGFRLAQQGMQLFHKKAAVGFHYQTFTFEQSCQRLERYSSGLNAFLSTEAGKAVAKRRGGLLFQMTELTVRAIAPLLRPLLSVVDSDIRMPNALYRLLYWYYGAYCSFWSRADKRLLADKS